MKKFVAILLAVLTAALFLSAAVAADAPEIKVDDSGRVTFSSPAGVSLHVAAYDPRSGQYLGQITSGTVLSRSALLKAIQTNASYVPVAAARSVLVVAEGGSYSDVSVDAALITGQAAAGETVTLSRMTVRGDLDVFGACDLNLDNVNVFGEVRTGASQASASVALQADGMPSIRILNNSGVGSIRIMQTAGGGIRVRTEEGCDVSWVYVDDGRGDIILNGSFNQVVVDTKQNSEVRLEGAKVTGLTINRPGARVSLQTEQTGSGIQETKVTGVKIREQAEGASLSVGENTTVLNVNTQAPEVSVTGGGEVVRAEVSGNGTRIDTENTWLVVEEETTGVTNKEKEVDAGTTVKTGDPQPVEVEHEHRWELAVVTEATALQPGVKTYICQVCGKRDEKVISFEPFSVTVTVGDEEQTARFQTLDEAMAFAAQHPWENGRGMCGYADIALEGSASFDVLELPAGYCLYVGDGGSLTVRDGFRMGSAREREDGAITVEATVEIPVNGEIRNSLTVGGKILYDADAPERGVIAAEPDGGRPAGEHEDLIFVAGGWTDMPETIVPALSLEGYTGVNIFRIQRDYNVNDYFNGLQTGTDDFVYIDARVSASDAWTWGSQEGNGGFILRDGGALLLNDYSVGYKADCNIQISKPVDAAEEPFVLLPNSGTLAVSGGNLTLRGNISEMPWLELDGDDAAAYTVTVEQGAAVRLHDNELYFP
ncbi:MAG: hypothetical protein IJU29_08140, partial [Oscillospiraceae bacterium]|nr:hypothetical protein [Oscillospiraceae bacterium]